MELNTQGDMSNEIILVVKYIVLECTWGVRIIMRSKHTVAEHWWFKAEKSIHNLKTSYVILWFYLKENLLDTNILL